MPVLDQKQELAKKADLLTKQDILIAGTGISIAADGKTISATGSGGSTVTVSPVLSTGTRIAAMEVDGTLYTLFAPTPPSVSVTQVQSSGTELARVVINGVSTSIYAPLSSTVLSGTTAPSAALGENNNIYVQYVDNSGTLSVVMTYVKLEGSWVQLTTGGGGGGNVDDVNVNGVSVVDANKVAQIVSYKEVTKAEYDALPASKLSDNILYCINDQMTADTTVAPIIYSEDEREIGVWTDGKPLYQKTISLTNTTLAQGRTQIDVSALGADKIVNQIDGWLIYTSSGTIYNLNLPYGVGTQYYITLCTADNTTINIERGGEPLVADTIQFTLQYTKTTDQPGSGKYAPSGVPAVHYSENEQVIGTWIDGSTVYEKTYSLSSLPQSSSITLEPNFTNCNLISCIGSFTDDAQRTYPSENKQVYVYVYNAQLTVQNNEAVKTNAVFIVRYTKSTS